MSTSHPSPAYSVDAVRDYRHRVEEAASFLRDRLDAVPSTGLVLEPGIGLPDDRLAGEGQWPFAALPHAPTGADEGERSVSVGELASTSLLTLDGALSLHEGFTPREVAFPVRVLAEAGVETLMFVNTAGSVDPVIEPGRLALVTDHVNFQGVNPLVGPNVDDWGPRFPDMTEPYDAELRAAAQEAALQHGIMLHEGVYFAMLGPSAGTQAEYRMVQSFGANLVGTGTVPEVIAARHGGMQVLALSIVTEQCLSEGTASSGAEGAPRAAAQSQLFPLLQEIIERERAEQ